MPNNSKPWLQLNDNPSFIWDSEYGQRYGIPSWSEQGNANANSWLDPNGSVSGLWNDLMGFTSQSREFAQQEYLQDKQNAYNTPAAQMQRMIDAGINPNFAAAGIAGSENISAQAPNVASATPSAAPIEAAGALFGGVGSFVANAALAATENQSRGPKIRNILADTDEKLSKTGLNDEERKAYSISNLYLGQKELLELQTLSKNLGVLDGQRDLFKAQVGYYSFLNKEIDQRIKLMKSQGNLADMQELVEQKRGLLLDQQTFELQWQNQIRQLYHIDPSLPIQNNSFLLWMQGDESYKQSLQTINDINYNTFMGQYSAESDTAFAISAARKNGENVSDKFYGRVGSWADAIGRVGSLLFGGYATVFEPKSSKGVDVRKSITSMIENLSAQLGSDENKDMELNNAIYFLTQALYLNDKELEEWYSKNVAK